MSFLNKVVLVTGASSGIGEATALMFAKNGARLTLVGRNEANLNKCALACEQESKTKPQVIVADLSIETEARTVVPQTVKHWGRLDVLINNAGKGKNDSIVEKEFVSTLKELINTNLISAAILTNDAVPHLVESRGNIVYISSIAALKQTPTFTSYCVSKSALDQLTKCTALELASKGVRVNSVNPGPVKTNFAANAKNLTTQQQENFYKGMETIMPLQRVAEADEIADLILFLASERAKSVTGSIYLADCGALLKSYSMTSKN